MILRDMGDGLILRRARLNEAETLGLFYAEAFRRQSDTEINRDFVAWIRGMALAQEHPFGAHNFTVVEDTTKGQIVSSLNLISQTWAYAGVDIPLGRIEPVATHAEYRQRGLVRAQFQVAHQWSAERGELAQAITGIPYFYRQFGYEMTIDAWCGRAGANSLAPRLEEGKEEPYRLRQAINEDAPFIKEMADGAAGRYLLTCKRDETIWRRELTLRGESGRPRTEMRIIESPSGEKVGFLAYNNELWNGSVQAFAYELRPGLSWAAVTPTVLRYLKATGEEYLKQNEKATEFVRIGFYLGAEHPAYLIAAGALPEVIRPYAFYVRVPDLPAFLRHIGPVLEQRLAGSPLAGHTGELKLSFYRSGLRLAFQEGKLAAVEAWRPTPGDDGEAAFPDLTFLKLLFGYRTQEEIQHLFPDCWAGSDTTRALLAALFPKGPSLVWPIA